jgi:hypothetical protein
MAQVSGADVKLAIFHEATWGVDPGVPDGKKLYFSTCGVNAGQNAVDDPTISGGRGRRRSGRGNVDISGNLDVVIAPENFGTLLYHILGVPVTVGVATPYTHTFIPKSLPPGFILEKDYTAKIASKVERFNGCRVASAQFSFPQEGFATCSISVSGKRHSINAAVLDATLTDPGHNGFSGFKGVVKRAGVQVGGVLSASLSIDNEMDTSLYTFPATGATAGERGALPEGLARITGQIETVFEDFAIIDLAKAGTDTTFEWVYQTGTGAGTAGNEYLSFLVDHSDIMLASPPIETASGLKVTYNFNAFASGAAMGLLVTLKNAVAAAAL